MITSSDPKVTYSDPKVTYINLQWPLGDLYWPYTPPLISIYLTWSINSLILEIKRSTVVVGDNQI